MTDATPSRRLDRLIFLPVLGALVSVWIILSLLTFSERTFTLERAESQLSTTVMSLADFNELAEQATGDAIVKSSEHRTAAIWRALLQYPSASIWFESNGEISGGQPPAGSIEDSIVADEARATFSVHAALPKADALVEWQRTARQRAIILIVATVAFLLLTAFLTRALRQRAVAEQEAVAERERSGQLAEYKVKLEETVAQRTGELRHTNALLKTELFERKAAEEALKQHDALLHSVAKSAAELLGSHSHEEAIASVLELIGQTVGAGRVHINAITIDRAGHLKSTPRHEWCAPGLTPLIDHPAFQDVDLTATVPRMVAPLVAGALGTFYSDDIPTAYKSLCDTNEIRSFLQIPIMVEEKLWGAINFVDSAATKREWTWAETDSLQTLAGLIGATITRARYVKELADANMIVNNSPTILYRVRGEPPFPLIYVSHNIRKFGHDADELIETEHWAQQLMDSEDQAKITAAMSRALEKDAQGASIEFRLRTGDGSYRWVENRYTTVRDRHGRLVEIEGMIIDITERKAAEEKIAHLARTDALTGLANRATFIERIRNAFSATQRGASPFAILYLDLDHFKTINDTLGHATGDMLLREVADRLRSCTRENDVVARLGGDEFAILQTDMREPANAGALAATIQTALARPYELDGNDLHVTTSIGICPYDVGSTGPDAMLAQADLALYRSKDEGRNRYRFHTDDLDHQVLERVTLADELRNGMEHGQLELYYQPQVELSSGKIVGMEAFVRWHHPTRGLLPASEFIPVAEKTGTIIALGQWVLEQACRQMRTWRDEGVNPPAVTMNLSLAQLKNSRELLKDVRAALEKWKLDPSDLCFDVTEATLAQMTLMRNDVLSELRRLGVTIAIDDFGSEYSSFDYLRTYRVNHLKMTQEFIDGAIGDPERAATVRAILNLAHELHIGVVTEGVETEEQLDLSAETSIIAQGYYFSKAVDVEEANALLRKGSIAPASTGQDSVDPDLSSILSRRRRAKGNSEAKDKANSKNDAAEAATAVDAAGSTRKEASS
jgi:diguanylate cyclase (GGDEF)-like protein/PAS domain S-box-containing protein